MKKFIAYDCSGKELLVLASNGKKLLEERVNASGTENLLPVIDKVLKRLKLEISDIEVLAVGVGPGSWTGSRVAVVTAYGLYEANKSLKIVPFNSFDLISYNGNDNEQILKLVKAYANFIYVQEPSGKILAITKDELAKKYSGYKLISCDAIVDDVIVVEACFEGIVRKIDAGQFVSIDDIEPMYLRLSQAEYQRNERLKGNK